MPVIFDSERLPQSQRMTMWREQVCATFAEIECDPLSDEPFRANMDDVGCGDVHFCEVAASPVDIQKSPALVRRAAHDNFMVCVQRSGTCVIEQQKRIVRLLPGDLVLLDSAQTYRVTFPSAFRQLVIHMPRARLLAMAPAAERQIARLLGDTSPTGSATARFLTDVSAQLRTTDATCADQAVIGLMGEGALRLVGAMVANAVHPARPSTERPLATRRPRQSTQSLFERSLGLIDQSCSDPEVSVQSLAAMLEIGVRRLEQVYQSHGMYPSDALWESRLRLACRLLTDDTRHPRSIGDIALHSGFSSFAHFSRAFRRRFGMTPREYRERQR